MTGEGRLGAVSIGIPGRTPLDTVRALATRVERLGFGTLWVNDLPNGDSLAALRAAAEVTDRIGLATGVIPLDRRPAESLDLDGLPADRLVLGVGSGAAARPLGLVRDGVALLRTRTDAAIVVGALGPRMRRLAATEADGVLLNWLTPQAAAEASADLCRDAADRPDRPATPAAPGRPVRAVLYVRTIADTAARGVLEREADGYARIPAYAANFERLGFRAIDATLDGPARLADYRAEVDEVVLRAITPAGTLEELEAFAEATAAWVPREG
ncbi:LLM class flavin-dependent oxidoreductase [Agromyces sp. MMS24-K17]|uniref:LLM class flavin-dependent oxidoreductase n=1 Tax=Agromyces sp. MMS24-K17 TaxID=3372850 RepID=UPI0037543814